MTTNRERRAILEEAYRLISGEVWPWTQEQADLCHKIMADLKALIAEFKDEP